MNQEVALSMLEELGCRVEVAADGREALERISQKTYDLVLMDCQMPELDGYEATRLIRQREHIEEPLGDGPGKALTHVPIIALTANALQGDREVCLVAGMDDFLSKPFSLEQLQGMLRKWLGERPKMGEVETTSFGQISSGAGAKAEALALGVGGVIEREALASIRALQRPGAPDLVRKVIDKYLDASSRLVQALRQAVREGDVRGVRQAAHSLKSSSANVGASRLAAQCKDLETEAQDNRIGDPAQLHALESEYQAVRAALQTELRESR
ncbi:MAG: response regulator [Deltaproteobacteria bacterium]|nr:response regulator [Deltaproteobacteria bacterium]